MRHILLEISYKIPKEILNEKIESGSGPSRKNQREVNIKLEWKGYKFLFHEWFVSEDGIRRENLFEKKPELQGNGLDAQQDLW